jgi:hypothetical protein
MEDFLHGSNIISHARIRTGAVGSARGERQL